MVDILPQFDWNKARDNRSPRKVEFWLQTFDKPLTEAKYVEQVKLLKPFSKATGRRRHEQYNPSRLKKEYRNLKERFGFFI